MNKSVVIIRGNPENHDKSRMEQYIQQNQIEVIGDGVETGKPFGRGMITRLYQQSELLPPE
tara:strand:+ start:115 stop:297 length:183 start_codon:yes stop_codon:yes gene_type:complete